MHASSDSYERDPVRRHAPLGRFAAVALAAGLLAACQSPALDGGDRFTRPVSADGAASASPGGGDRFDGTVSTDSAKRATYGGLGNRR